MPRIKFTILILLTATLFGQCTSESISVGSWGQSSNSKTGISFEHNGLKVNDVVLMVNEEAHNTREVPLESDVQFNLVGLRGFNFENGKAFIDCNLYVESSTGEKVISLENMFDQAYPDGLDSTLTGQIEVYFQTREPMVAGEEYKVVINMKDRKSEGYLNVTMDMIATESELPPSTAGINMVNSGVKVETVHLIGNNEFLPNTTVSQNMELEIQFRGVDGFEAVNDNYELEFRLLVFNADRTPIDDVSRNINGNDASYLSGRMTVDPSIFESGKQYWVVWVYSDYNSDDEVAAEMLLEVE